MKKTAPASLADQLLARAAQLPRPAPRGAVSVSSLIQESRPAIVSMLHAGLSMSAVTTFLLAEIPQLNPAAKSLISPNVAADSKEWWQWYNHVRSIARTLGLAKPPPPRKRKLTAA